MAPSQPYQGIVTRNPGEVKYAPQFAVEGNDTSAYAGTDPQYQTYASDTEKPFEDNAEAPEEDDGDDEAEDTPQARPPSTPSLPPSGPSLP